MTDQTLPAGQTQRVPDEEAVVRALCRDDALTFHNKAPVCRYPACICRDFLKDKWKRRSRAVVAALAQSQAATIAEEKAAFAQLSLAWDQLHAANTALTNRAEAAESALATAKAEIVQWEDNYNNACKRADKATARIEKLEAALRNLAGQVKQARDGMGVYANSPSMAEALVDAEVAIQEDKPHG